MITWDKLFQYLKVVGPLVAMLGASWIDNRQQLLLIQQAIPPNLREDLAAIKAKVEMLERYQEGR